MICPDCGYDNIAGVDVCEQCGQPLVEFDNVGSEIEEWMTKHSAKILCPKRPIAVPSSLLVRDAIQQMIERKIGCLLVEDEGLLVGIFTERDVLERISADARTLDGSVAEFMTPSPVTLSADDSIAYALHAMDLGDYRHLPLVDATGSAVGIISVRDILRFLCIRFSATKS